MVQVPMAIEKMESGLSKKIRNQRRLPAIALAMERAQRPFVYRVVN
jgi:hypothetical protein